ncbi:putative variant ionotropic glutamate receptor-like 1 [Homarus americanus]|uniref:Putative variant ionotropic glutamate receptor-like 1 n=1 Tax=Homarus americanus TaxID=6706 RepID=A0A8J5TKP1_HOMAM|nr:putative variant ionotropic glutamate receptor-like 1 [Homarus americanus]
MTLEAVQETAHLTLSLGVNETWWPHQQVPAFIHGSSLLHLVLFLTHQGKFLHLVPSCDAHILSDNVFDSVEKLALICELPGEVYGRRNTMGVFTLLPFSSSNPKFLGTGPWAAGHYTVRVNGGSSYARAGPGQLEQVQGQPFLGGVAATWLYLQRGIFSQGVPALPRALWQRMFLAAWYLYCLVVSAAYTCNLIAIFTCPAYPQRITTLQQLADGDYRMAEADLGSFLPNALKESKDANYRRLGKKLDLLPQKDDTLAAMLAGTPAVFGGAVTRKVILGVHHKVFPSHVSWIFPKYTPWKYKFDQGIQRLVEADFIQYWIKEITTQTPAASIFASTDMTTSTALPANSSL